MSNLTQPAFPVVPIQDNFKRLIVPVPGISKLEHFALEIYKARMSNNPELFLDFNFCIADAIYFLEKLDEKLKTINNEKNNDVAIFDR